MACRCERNNRRLRNQYLENNAMGLEQQRLIGKAVSKQIGITLEETGDIDDYGEFFYFDWVNEEHGIFGELKWRRVHKNAYKTTIVGEPKIKYALSHPDKSYFFVFRFVDGLYFCHFKDIDTKQKPRLIVAKEGSFREWVYDVPISILRPLHELSFDFNDRGGNVSYPSSTDNRV